MPDYLPAQFATRVAGLAIWQWLGLLVLLVVAYLARCAGRYLASRVLRLRERFRGERIGEDRRGEFRGATGLLAAAILPSFFIGELDLPSKFELIVLRGLETVMVLGLVLFGFALWDSASDSIAARHVGDNRTERLLLPVARKFVRATIVFAGVLVALGFVYQVNVAAVLASLGIGGLVIALAGKDSLENIVGSINMLFDMPYAIGDRIRFDKYEGVVEEINLRSTKLRTLEGSLITLPNANLVRSAVENLSPEEGSMTVRLKVPASRPIGDTLKGIEGLGEGLHAQVLEYDGKEFTVLVRARAGDAEARSNLLTQLQSALAEPAQPA